MSYTAIAQSLGLVLSSLAFAFVLLGAIGFAVSRHSKRRPGFMQTNRHAVAFLFEEEKLVNATDDAKSILTIAPKGQSDWTRLLSIFTPKYPGLVTALLDLTDLGSIRVPSADATSELVAEWRDGLVRIQIHESGDNSAAPGTDQLSIAAMQQEIETLRAASQNAPFLVWREQPDGSVSWANETYLELVKKMGSDGAMAVWPPLNILANQQPSSDGRLRLQLPDEPDPRWYEYSKTAVGNDLLHIANSADPLVKAETSLRDFVQTLTQTFAHLTIGLAIFDKQRQLSVFNPALSELTRLSPEFLTARPSLHMVLDRLRENRMIPEHKDYKSWRKKLQDLEAAAIRGTYEETWPLASGQTYRVVGRPHPDGAVAFIFEDISAEVSLTRRYRAELETGQAVIDSLEEAIAVFSSGGSLTVSNAAYARLWKSDPSQTVANCGITEAAETWARACAPTPIWEQVREFVTGIGERREWTTGVHAKNGQAVAVRFSPLPGGFTLVGFKCQTEPQQVSTNRAPTQPRVGDGSLAI